jgi:hypothetical protein
VPVLNRLPATRIVAKPAALDSAAWPKDSLVLRLAADEALIIPPISNPTFEDPHAIVVADNGFAGVWLPWTEAQKFLERTCDWELPHQRPALAQGSIAGLPAKLWLEAERVLFVVPAPYIHDFEERMA